MRLIHHSELDKQRWDQLVSFHSADVFSFSWYLDACAQDWSVLVDDDFENGIVLPFTVKLGVKAVSPPIFVRNLDFVGEESRTFREKSLQLLQESFKVGVMQLSLPVDRNAQHDSAEHMRIFQVVSDIPVLNSQAKRMLQKATKNGITVAQTSDWKAVLQIIKLELSEKISEFTVENLGRLEKLIASLEKEKRLFCLGIYRNGALEGGMVFMESAGKRIYLKGAAGRETRDLGGMYLCMHESIQQTVAGNRLFDFGGSEVEGVRRFNLNLGGTDRHYYIYSWNNAPWWFNLTKRMYQKWKKK